MGEISHTPPIPEDFATLNSFPKHKSQLGLWRGPWDTDLLLSCSVVSTLCDPMHCSMLGFSVLHISWSLPKFMTIEWGDAIQPSHPLSPLLLLPSIFPSIRVLKWVGSSPTWKRGPYIAKIRKCKSQSPAAPRPLAIAFCSFFFGKEAFTIV